MKKMMIRIFFFFFFHLLKLKTILENFTILKWISYLSLKYFPISILNDNFCSCNYYPTSRQSIVQCNVYINLLNIGNLSTSRRKPLWRNRHTPWYTTWFKNYFHDDCTTNVKELIFPSYFPSILSIWKILLCINREHKVNLNYHNCFFVLIFN